MLQRNAAEICSRHTLPVASGFDRLLNVRMLSVKGVWGETSYEEIEHKKVLRIPACKPAKSSAPTSEDLSRLAPLELALANALKAQRVCFDAEALDDAFSPLLKAVGDMQVHTHQRMIRAH